MDNKALIDKLSSWGADTEAALARMLDDEEMYIMLLNKYKDTFRLDELRSLIAEGKTEPAFELAHMLKGMIGNLGLTPMYDIVLEIVEPLRRGSVEGLAALADELIKKKAELDALIG